MLPKLYPFLQGGGEMAERTRNFDWSLTSLGPPDGWPSSLRTTVSNLLRSKFPMFLWWGEDMVQFYNDAYRPSLGNNGKHPYALGQKGKDCWPEIWDIISPLHHQVRTTGEATWMENQLVPIYRNGKIEEVYWTYSYSSVLDDEGNHGGILVTCVETTDVVIERKKIEQSQKELLQLFEESAVAVATISKDDDLVFEFANSFYGVLVGRKPEEITGRPLLDALPEIKGQGFDQLLKQVIRTSQPYIASEVAVDIRRSGKMEKIYVDLTYQPRMERETICGVLVIATDVTNQVRARKKIEESEARFRNMVHQAPIAITLTRGMDVVIESINAPMLRFMNKVTTEEVLGKKMLEVLPELEGQPALQTVLNVQKTGVPFRGDEQPVDLLVDGQLKRFYFNFSYTPIIEDGRPVSVLHLAIDVTEQVAARQELEEKKQQLQRALEQVRLSKEAAELGTFDMDLVSGTLHWDDRCRTLFGISHQNPVTYEKDFAGGLHPDDRDRILNVIEGLFVKSISNGDYDVEYRTIGAEDGIIRWVRAKGKVYFNDQDKPVRFIGSVLDITDKVTAIQKIEKLVEERTKELAEANQTLQNINNELQRSNQNLFEFAYAASHDLKEPIRKIHFFSNSLKAKIREKITDEERIYFEKLESASNRMNSLIDDLLQYSQVSMQERKNEQVNLDELLQHVLSDLELEIVEKKAKISSSHLPTVVGHHRQVQQAFSNIISNALKYKKQDLPPHIAITCRTVTGSESDIPLSASEMGKSFYAIRFTDNGIGFDPADTDRIFNVFTRLHANAQYKGTGVGLSIVRRVMQNHNGYVTAKSTLGQGAVFELFFPKE